MGIRGERTSTVGTGGSRVVRSVLATVAVGVTGFGLVAGVAVVAYAATTPETDTAPSAGTVLAVQSAAGANGPGRAATPRADGRRNASAGVVAGSGQNLTVAVRAGVLTQTVRAERPRRKKVPSFGRVVISDLRGGHSGWVLSAHARLRSGKALPPGMFRVTPRCVASDKGSAPGVRNGGRRDLADRPVLCVKDQARGPAGSTSGTYSVTVKVDPLTKKARKLGSKVIVRTRLR